MVDTNNRWAYKGSLTTPPCSKTIYFNILTYKIITHSNNALNDIFEKISKLDVDEKHLLRLGQGESVLKLGKSYSKSGRIDYMLNKRL